MRFDIITIFPNMFQPVMNESMLKKAQKTKKVIINVHDLREYSKDKHKKVDDRPFGGGPGMLMTIQPIYDAVKKIKGRRQARVIMTCPTGKPLTQDVVKRLAKEKNLIIICGHYEGVDDRVGDCVVDESISIGDYILTGGEIPAMVFVDSISRLIPGVLGAEDALANESFEGKFLEYPQYTRPADFRGIKVPDVVLSGHRKNILDWQKDQSRKRTKKNRPDLLSDLG